MLVTPLLHCESTSSSPMDNKDELQKQNTDCVYFLASPLTCKKGIDCEYRHNEVARLNPRDCWYWLAGNCLNPTCAFRHPPLEIHTKAPSESSVSSEVSSKINVPCYFYFSSFCNKGEKCSFMHGPDPKKTPPPPAGKSGNSTSEVREGVVALDDIGNDNISPLKDVNHNSSETVQTVSQNEKAISLKPGILLGADSFVQICTDQTPEEQMEEHVDSGDRRESSPGFDVLVDDKLENLGGYEEDDQEYLLALNREHKEISNHFLRYNNNIEDIVEYDPADPSYCEEEEEDELCDSFDHVDGVHIIDLEKGSLLSHKRKFLSINDQRAIDLRDHLRRRRLIDVHQVSQSSKRRNFSHLLCYNQERTRRPPGISHRLQGRIIRPSSSYMSKEKRVGNKKSFPSKVPRKVVDKERRSSREFTGPKTLAQIREKKKKTANGDFTGETDNSSGFVIPDFEAPKPLSEILKDKKRSGFC